MSDTTLKQASKKALPPMKSSPASTAETVQIDLRQPALAALLAWLVPGLGHFYQRRWAKGALFCVCILGTYIFGVVLGAGKVVHTGGTSQLVRGTLFSQAVQRWTFVPQACVGVPAVISLVQHVRVSGGGQPLFGGWFAPPRSIAELGSNEQNGDELSYWNEKLNSRYDIGMLFTMVAGLLNVLVIYDAYAGPVIAEEAKDEEEDGKAGKENDKQGG